MWFFQPSIKYTSFFIRLGLCFLCFMATVWAQSDEVRAKLDRGKELMARGKFEEAIQVYRELVFRFNKTFTYLRVDGNLVTNQNGQNLETS